MSSRFGTQAIQTFAIYFQNIQKVYFTFNIQPFKSDCLTTAAALLNLLHLPEHKTILSQFSYVEARKNTQN
jgi:hypothetical protein